MGDEHERGPVARPDGEEELDDRPSGRGVEIAGRLVGQKQLRFVGQSARERHPLLFASRKLRGEMVHSVCEPHLGEELGRAGERTRSAGEFHRQGDVLARGHRGHEMEGLEQEADVATPEARESVLVEPAQVLPAHDDTAAARPFDSADDREEARFARTRRPHHARGGPGLDLEVDPAQDRNRPVRALEHEMNILEIDHHRNRRFLEKARSRSDMERMPLLRKLASSFLATALLFACRLAVAECRIAVLGDSLTAGYGLPLAEAFPARLEAALRARGFSCSLIDAGVSGDTSAGGAARVDWVLADRPSHLLVELGGNDALRALPPEQLERNLERIVEAARARGVPVMIAGMLAPPNLGREYGEALALAFRRVVERYGLAFYPFFLDGLVGRPELFQPDGIHPNRAGVEVVVERILPTVEAWLRASGIEPGR